MASTVVESSVIDAPIERVWPFVRSVDFRFLNVVAKSELLSGDGWAEVGSVRRLTYNDKQSSTRTYVLEELSDVTRQVVFSAMGATPKSEIAAASHTIRMRPITHPCNKTFVQFESSYSRDITPQMLEDSKNHKRSFFVALQRIVKEACDTCPSRSSQSRNQPQQLRGQPQQQSRDQPQQQSRDQPQQLRGQLQQQQQPSRDQPQHEQTQFSGREPSQFSSREPSQFSGREPSQFGGREPSQIESSRKPEGKSYGFTPLVGKMELQQQQQPPKRQSEREGKAKPTAESSSGGGFHLDPVFEARFPEQYDRPQYSIGAGTGGRVIPVTDLSTELSTDTSPPQLTRQKAHSPSTTSSPFGPRGASAAAGAGQSAQRPFGQSPQSKPKVSKGKSQLMSELRRRAAEQKMEPAEVLEALNFDEIKWLGAQSAEKLWEIADKDKSGTLDRNEATNLVGHLMRRISEEENDLVHAVSKMFAEPGEPSSFASTQDFTNQLLDELAKKRPAATAELLGHLDKNRDGTIEKDEFRVLFSEWLRREVYSEMRSCFFG